MTNYLDNETRPWVPDSDPTVVNGNHHQAGVNGAQPIGVAQGVVVGTDHTNHRTRRATDRLQLATQKAEATRARKAADLADRLAAKRARRADRRDRWSARWTVAQLLASRLRPVAPLLMVNASAVYGQIAYAYETISPAVWSQPARLALALMFAAAVESIALYVGWHAHDALLAKAFTRARHLRAGSYVVAAVVGGMNYAHFAGPAMAPTAAAAGFGLLSLMSPWLWGLHTRRQRHIQLVAESEVDRAGVEFDPRRRRQFPILTWRAGRWAIMHNVTDPAVAWDRCLAEITKARAAKEDEAQRRVIARHAQRIAEMAAAKGQPGEAMGALQDYARTLAGPPVKQPTARNQPASRRSSTNRRRATNRAGANQPTRPVNQPPPDESTNRAWSPALVANAAALRKQYANHLPDSDQQIRKDMGWQYQRAKDSRVAYLAGADLTSKEQP